MDLGSGQGITSIFLVKEYGFKVYATDLWSDPEDDKKFYTIIMGANIGTTINSQILRLANVEESSWLALIFPATIAPVPLIY